MYIFMYISLLKLNQRRVWIRTLSPTSLSPSLFSFISCFYFFVGALTSRSWGSYLVRGNGGVNVLLITSSRAGEFKTSQVLGNLHTRSRET